jgi:hypothetical protein
MPQPWRYRHTQFGTVIVGSLAASGLFLMGLGMALGDRVFMVGEPAFGATVAARAGSSGMPEWCRAMAFSGSRASTAS